MDQSNSPILDQDLGPHDIQSLSDSNAISAFFAHLGYNTDVHSIQSPENLGITATSVISAIKKIELIADQDGYLQVYLFELTSVTVGNTRALGKVFRNRPGNYLLVLTSDYEHLDFVLFERYLPVETGSRTDLGQKQTGIRPHVLTIERRKPIRIHIRVLRRFTWTESDPFAQYDKLLSAYTVAEWSEEAFNNRALFSDYYLLERLPGFPIWSEDPKPAYLRLRELYLGAASLFAGKEIDILREKLLEPIFQELGFISIPNKRNQSENDVTEPDYRLYSPLKSGTADQKSPPLALCLVYPWGRFLDGKDDWRDKENPDENPGAVVVSLLDKGESPWVVVTNGKLWRLYAQHAHSRATNYYEIDVEEVLAQDGSCITNPSESIAYFWLLFRCQAFELKDVIHEGKKSRLSLLDQLLLGSTEYAKELGERLKERVFEKIFPRLAAGFIACIRQARGNLTGDSDEVMQPQGATPVIGSPGESFHNIFQGTLALLYRLLFLLYAEARDLLPVKEARGYYEESLTKMKGEVASIAGNLMDEAEKNIRNTYHEDRYELYDRLLRLFRTVDEGNPSLNVPFYDGGLFLSNPSDEDESPEAQTARFLNTAKVPDRFLACALDLLTRDIDHKRHDLVFIDYKSLGVRQLGSIYEGLLEFKLRIADQELAFVKEKEREVYKALRELDERSRERAEKQGRIIKKGQVYLENDKRERKATGSFYTPDHIVKYIVEHAVGPVLEEKFNLIRPKLREAQYDRRAFFQKQKELERQGIKPEPESKADVIGKELVNELFDIKVLDPAMGSGHFLVETVDYITDKTLNFLNSFPWNPVIAYLARMRDEILREMEDRVITIDIKRLTDVNLLKRHVLRRCIYGVDLNPMAVELAKGSLWLDCFTLGAPLSFLDHHLRCGNSFIGATVKEAKEAVEPVTRVSSKTKVAASATEWKTRESRVTKYTLFGSRFAGLLLATDLMRHVGELSDVTSNQVRESRKEYKKAFDALAPFKRILDVYTSQWFGNEEEKKGRGEKCTCAESPAITFLKKPEAEALINAQDVQSLRQSLENLSPEDRKIAEVALNARTKKRFFHWELEFPEVFYGPRAGSRQAIERKDGAGFDAVIGNPPYDVLASEEFGFDISKDLTFYETTPLYKPAIHGKKNLYKLFICRGASVMGPGGAFSFIVPMSLLGDDQSVGVRRLLLEKTGLTSIEVFPQKDDPKNRVFPEAKLATTIFVTRAKQSNEHFMVRTHPGALIERMSPRLHVSPEEITKFDPQNAPIPSCSQRDWNIAVTVISNEKVKRLGDYCRASQGEVNETTDGKKGFISEYPDDGHQILRGSNICLYITREASQGKPIYLIKQKYLKEKPSSIKAHHHEHRRVGWQESSPQNNFRRIIAAIIPEGEFCNHKINYIPEDDAQLSLDFVLTLLNSQISDWFFRLGSSNAAISHYQIYALPSPSIVDCNGESNTWNRLLRASQWADLKDYLCEICIEPGEMPKSVADTLAELCRRIQEIEAKRILKNRSERSHLATESQLIQDVIDAVLFRCYGLSGEEAQYIGQRLKEML